MSGIEVIGLVLGILPLAIKGLKSYKSMLSDIKSANRDLTTLIHNLETEHIILLTTCELLLNDLVPLSQIDGLVKDPFGQGWGQFNDDIRVRLWTATDKFTENAKDMLSAAKELQEKLSLEEDGMVSADIPNNAYCLLTVYLKPQAESLKAIISRLKHKASFSLRKKDYEVIMSRIKTANCFLRDIVGQTGSLEPNRRRRSQGRVNKLIRNLSRSIFEALRCATTCQCVQNHDACLELVPRKASIVEDDIEDEVAKTFDFRVVLGSQEHFDTAETVGNNDDNDTSLRVDYSSQRMRWDSVSLRFEPKCQPKPHPDLSSICRDNSQDTRRRVRFSQSLGFGSWYESASASTTQTVTISSELELATRPVPTPVKNPSVVTSDLCKVLATWNTKQKALAAECCGYIEDTSLRFGVYPQHDDGEFKTAVTLRQIILNGQKNELPPFNHVEKLRVALAVSISLLHLYDTPWLLRTLSLDDIVFFRGAQDRTQCQPPLGPFLAKSSIREPAAAYPSNAVRGYRVPMNPLMLSLGALLVQLMLGYVVPELDLTSTSEITLDKLLEKHQAGERLKAETLQAGGANYMAAVNWCLGSVLSTAGLGSMDFSQGFHEEVVIRLENDIKQLM
ncbi:hypothetical protein FSHL1_006955 [Fusarium sambucinum]